MNVLDIAVIGRGIAGLATAFELTETADFKKGAFRISLFGKKDGASEAALGIVASKGLFLPKNPLFKLQLTEADFFLNKRLSTLEALSSKRSIPKIKGVWELYKDLKEQSMDQKKRVYVKEFRGAFCQSRFNQSAPFFCSFFKHHLKGDFDGGWHFPLDGWFHPPSILKVLEEILKKRGVLFFENKILKIESFSNQVFDNKAGKSSLSLCFNDESSKGTKNKIFSEAFVCAGYESINLLDQKSDLFFAIKNCSKNSEGRILVAKNKEKPSFFAIKAARQGLVFYDDKIYAGSFKHDNFESILLNENPVFSFFLKNIQKDEISFLKGIRLQIKDKCPVAGFYKFKNHRLGLNFGYYKNGFILSFYCAKKIVSDFLSLKKAEGFFIESHQDQSTDTQKSRLYAMFEPSRFLKKQEK